MEALLSFFVAVKSLSNFTPPPPQMLPQAVVLELKQHGKATAHEFKSSSILCANIAVWGGGLNLS